MFSIKSSIFSNCMSCALLEAPSCILETNSPNNLKDVDVIFIAENPGKDEISSSPPTPLVGRAGKIFRKPFNSYIRDNFKWLLTNCVLCASLNPDGTTGNPKDEIIHNCKENCFKIIEICNPKLVVLMGTAPMKAFGIAESGITSLRGKTFTWRNYNIFLTVHPSYVLRNPNETSRFENDIRHVAELMGAKIENKDKQSTNITNVKGIHYYKLPDKYYSADYKLVDVQYLSKSGEVLYIFRDKDNKKIYHKENDDYYCYYCPESIENKKVIKYDNLYQIRVPYKNKIKLDPDSTYEGDVRITVKHAQDYYLQKKIEEPDIPLNIMFVDIETYSDDMEFPEPSKAEKHICMITYEYQGQMKTYVIDPKVLKVKNQKVNTSNDIIMVSNEKDLVERFIKDLKKLDPDVITGWSVIHFDFAYIFNRCDKIGVNKYSLSKYQEVVINSEYDYADVAGYVVLDMLRLYRQFTQDKKENEKLGTIAEIEIGETKIEGGGANFSNLFRTDINKAIEYNRRDVELTVKLENRLKHIVLLNEIRQSCRTCMRSAQSSMGQLDSLIVSTLKEKGFSSKNAHYIGKEKQYEGAFVKAPKAGIHEYVIDLDFTSLYPSLIMTYNIGVNTFVMKFKDYQMGFDYTYHPEKIPDKFTIILDPLFQNQEMEVDRDKFIKKVTDSKLISSVSGCFFRPHCKEVSFYSEILENIMGSRKMYKSKMLLAKQDKKDKEADFYNMRQLVYKVLANALYGIIGSPMFRFFNMDLARTITLGGQEIIKTSIIHADDYIETLKSGKSIDTIPLTKKEMYSEVLERDTRNVITGDTDSLFLTFEELISEKLSSNEKLKHVLSLCDMVSKYLNDEIIKEVVNKHNISEDRSRLELKNELIIKRGLFVAKKRYAIFVVMQEGKKIEETVIMGIETKRSDYPSYTKECLKDLINLVLKSKTITLSDLHKYVLGKEKEFYSRAMKGDKTVARPVSFGKVMEEYKIIPQNVVGMDNWNKLMYRIFDTGTKGYLFKLNGINLEKAPKEVIDAYDKEFLGKGKKLDVICIPDEEKYLPEWFLPDVKSIVKLAWKDRYQLLLEPLLSIKPENEIERI